MIFSQLTNSIRNTSNTLRSAAGKAINQFLTVRNWLIGFYIVEFEQRGEDRAQYGERLLETLAKGLRDESLSHRNLKLYRQFFQTYPQIAQVIPDFLQKNNLFQIGQSPIAQLQGNENKAIEIGQENLPILQSVIAKFNEEKMLVDPERLLSELSYTHLVQLFPIKDHLKRAFYEIECINGCWSVRELQRQIETLYYERCGMSLTPEKLIENISQLNTYVSYYKENMRRTDDNEPIGILLCTNKSDELVRYATTGMDNKLFVSQYLIELPKDEEWQRFVEQLKRKQNR